MQLGAAVAVLTALVLELPVSTSHCLVGSVIGASLAERVFDGSKTVDFKVLGRILVSWLITIPLAMAIACAFYAVVQAVDRPLDSKQNRDQVAAFGPRRSEGGAHDRRAGQPAGGRDVGLDGL